MSVQRKPRITLWIAAALVAVLGLGATGLWLAGPGARPAESATAVPESAIEAAASVEGAFVAIADALRPSVVNISTRTTVSAERPSQGDEPSDRWRDLPDWFREMLPRDMWPDEDSQEPEERQRSGLGSGVIIDPEGYILTNRHVVGEADRITVDFADGTNAPARVMATDQYTDLAVIKVDTDRPLKAATLGNADNAKAGSWAIAIGSPFGWEGSVTVGVVSAKNRQIPIPDIEGRSYRNLIQTDAPINPGNSGGPLVNIRGEVIGINQQIASPVRANAGLGFAIPIDDTTKEVIESLKRGKVPERGLLGVSIQDVTPAIAQVYGVKDGAFVGQVMSGTAADKAGIKEGDVIVAFGDTPVHESDDLVEAVTRTEPGTKVQVRFLRDGKQMTLSVKVGRLEAPSPRPVEPKKTMLGLTVSEITEALAQRYRLGDLGDRQGVVVTRAEPAGDAALAGIQVGDVILEINRMPTDSVGAYEKAVAALKPGGPAVIRAWRRGRAFVAAIEKVGE